MPTYKIPQSDLPENGNSKKFEFDDTSVLVACVDNEYYAVSSTCAHWGGPLEEGVICGHAVMCPWHHACYDLRDGKMLEPPALDGVQSYPVQLQDGELAINITTAEDADTSASWEEDINFVIVGGGAAGQAAAEELRHQGFNGQITILSRSSDVPVDRPNLSKDYLAGNADPEWIPLRSCEWYEENGIEIRLNTTVKGIDTQQNRLRLSNGETLTYHKLLLASGGRPRELKIPGHELKGIFSLRDWKDANTIIDAAKDAKRVAIVGSSFIGMEVAASLAIGRKLEVTVIGTDRVPFKRVLGEDIGQMLMKEQESHGVIFRLEQGVDAFEGEDNITGVRLKNGEIIAADMVIVGIGVQLNTEFLQDSDLTLGDGGAVLTNEFLQTNNPDIFAAGDIACWQDSSTGKTQRIEHWRVALQQGAVAAHNMMGNRETVTSRVPFFWTNQGDIALGYVGHAASWDEIIYRHGTPAEKTFLAYYLKDGKMQAAVAVNRDDDLQAIDFLLQQGQQISAAQIMDESFDPVKLVA